MSNLKILLSIFIFPLSGFGLIGNIPGRNIVDLGGRWQIILDPYDTGYFDYHMRPQTKEGFFTNRIPQDKTERIEYRFSPDHTLEVPGDWNTQLEKLFYYEGTIWYKKDFDRPSTSGRLFLYFEAVNYFCDVYLNGEWVGRHIGGFTPFEFEVTNYLKDKGNFLVLRVNNTRIPEGVPGLNTDWWNYGGITRRVLLVSVPETFIEDYFIQLAKGSFSQIQGWVKLNGPEKRGKIQIEIPELSVSHPIYPDSEGKATFSFSAKPRLWTPENPKLYRVILHTKADRVEEKIGFRSIQATEDEIVLNGKPIFLKGICIHEEAPFRGGRAFRPEEARILLGWAKELGCNFVRLAHYPHHEYMTRTADEMGLLVWSEIPVYWTIHFDNPNTYANAENQLVENITRDKNRASIIFWSIANETPVTESRNQFLRRLAEKARSLDPTRLITSASDKSSSDGFTYTISDPICEFLDVIGVNEYIGWYDGLPEKCDRVSWKRTYRKPGVVSEFGGGALYGVHGDSLTRWSEEFQENLYRHQIDMLERMEFLRGVTPWILMDFRSPRRPLYGIQDGWNRKGVISNFGQKKKAFWVLKAWYARK